MILSAPILSLLTLPFLLSASTPISNADSATVNTAAHDMASDIDIMAQGVDGDVDEFEDLDIEGPDPRSEPSPVRGGRNGGVVSPHLVQTFRVEPIAFASGAPQTQAQLRIAMGREGYVQFLPRAEYALSHQFSVMGEVGRKNGGGLAQVGARYAPIRTPGKFDYASVSAYLGVYSYGRTYPQLTFEGNMGKAIRSHFFVQARLAADLILGTSNPNFGPGIVADLEYETGLQLAYRLQERWLVGVESTLQFEPTQVTGSDQKVHQLFADISATVSYTLDWGLQVGGAISIPTVHRYQWDHDGALRLFTAYAF